jgi:heptosyltransferase-3
MKKFSRVLVIKLKQPGDVLLSTPVLAALKEAWPESQVTYLVPRGTEDMVADHPQLSGLMVVDRWRQTWRETWRFLKDLRRRRFDLVLELSGGDRGAFYSLAAGATERLGFARGGKSPWQHACFTQTLPLPPLRMHMVEHNLQLLRPLGIKPQRPRLQFFWHLHVESRVQEMLQALHLQPGGFVVLHPGAGWRFKCWTPSGYARIIEALQGERGLPVVLTASRAALEGELLAAILAAAKVTPFNLAGRLSLKELGALISRARFFFGVDSAPMHLAAAVGTPVVALFGPSGDFNWGPWGEGHLVIKKDWDCIPCGRDGCQGSKVSRCLTEITPEEVWAKMEEHFEFLGRGQGVEPPALPQTPSPPA